MNIRENLARMLGMNKEIKIGETPEGFYPDLDNAHSGNLHIHLTLEPTGLGKAVKEARAKDSRHIVYNDKKYFHTSGIEYVGADKHEVVTGNPKDNQAMNMRAMIDN